MTGKTISSLGLLCGTHRQRNQEIRGEFEAYLAGKRQPVMVS